MIIYVTGAGSKKKAQLITNACRFYMQKYGFRLNRYLEIRIIFCEQETDGYCDFNNDFRDPEIEITINKTLDDVERLKTLAHELTHAKQFLKKELKFKNHDILWKGNPSVQHEWEDEAYDMEEKLYSDFINANN
jgi:hypothetical protein